jgi:hypothetical protein
MDGHVCTTDTTCIPNAYAKKLLTYGSTFRFNTSISSIIHSLELALDNYIASKNRMNHNFLSYTFDNTYASDLQLWKSRILSLCSKNLSQSQKTLKQKFIQVHSDKQFLNILKDNFTICIVDKLKNNYALVCKHLYKHKLYEELNSDSYSSVSTSIDNIFNTHRIYNSKHNFEHINRLPYLYATPKLHKPPPKFRFIAGVNRNAGNNIAMSTNTRSEPYCSTTACSIELSKILKMLFFGLSVKMTYCIVRKAYVDVGL